MNTVILADDHPLLLRGLCDLLGLEDDFRIVAAANGGNEALSAIKDLRPSLAVLDVAMPDISGLDVLKAVRADRIDLKVIFLTATIAGPQITDALCLGVNGILLKESAPEGLINCMRQVCLGKNWIAPEILTNVRSNSTETEMLRKLSPRENEVVALVCSGLSNKSIALRLGTTEGTIKVHLQNIYQKLNINSRMVLASSVLRSSS